MNEFGSKPLLGIVTDEDAMFELLTKFLIKEGYETKRVSSDAKETKDMALIILAPTRDPSRSRSWFENLRKTKPAVLVLQCCDEDYAGSDENVVLMKDRPLNLRQLGDVIKSTLQNKTVGI